MTAPALPRMAHGEQLNGDRPAATILLIEDDPASQMLAERALRQSGYHVLIARRALDGLQIARRERPNLILTSLTLPDLSGRELVAAFRQEPDLRHTPIVGLTGDAVAGRNQAVAGALAGMLRRPLDAELLPVRVAQFLRVSADGDSDESVALRLEHQAAALRELEGANQELEQRAATVEALLAQSVADLRTPLSLISGYQQLMHSNPQFAALIDADLTARQLVDGMGNAVTQLNRVMERLGMLSRVLSGPFELATTRVKLAEVLARSVSAFAEPMHIRRLSLRFERVNFPNVIEADEPLLELVFRQLLNNAIRFTPDDGSITVAARIVPGAVQGNMLRFSIRDTGVGIPADDLERIFGVYSSVPGANPTDDPRTDFLSPGAGLGLTLCQRIIEAHGGRIWAESPGYSRERLPGSEFVMVLPVQERRPG